MNGKLTSQLAKVSGATLNRSSVTPKWRSPCRCHTALPFATCRYELAVEVDEGIDATTPAGKLQMHILGAIAEFEPGADSRARQGGSGTGESAAVRLSRPPPQIDPARLAIVA